MDESRASKRIKPNPRNEIIRTFLDESAPHDIIDQIRGFTGDNLDRASRRVRTYETMLPHERKVVDKKWKKLQKEAPKETDPAKIQSLLADIKSIPIPNTQKGLQNDGSFRIPNYWENDKLLMNHIYTKNKYPLSKIKKLQLVDELFTTFRDAPFISWFIPFGFGFDVSIQEDERGKVECIFRFSPSPNIRYEDYQTQLNSEKIVENHVDPNLNSVITLPRYYNFTHYIVSIRSGQTSLFEHQCMFANLFSLPRKPSNLDRHFRYSCLSNPNSQRLQIGTRQQTYYTPATHG
jgi:hypothetical protein